MKKLFVVSGPSGVGKGTLLAKFIKDYPEFKLSISCTTRSKRAGETDGVDYHFLTREEFIKAVDCGEFLEWAEFSGNFYGTGLTFVKKGLENNENIILEIDTKGALQVKEKMAEAVLIFIAPPSLEILEARLRGRNTESDELVLKRLSAVQSELENSKQFHYIVVNDDLEKAVKELEKIIKNEQI